MLVKGGPGNPDDCPWNYTTTDSRILDTNISQHNSKHIVSKVVNMFMNNNITFVECVSEIEHIISVIHYTMYGAVCF